MRFGSRTLLSGGDVYTLPMAKLLLFIGICFFLAGEASRQLPGTRFVIFVAPLAVTAVESFELANDCLSIDNRGIGIGNSSIIRR